MSKYNPRSKLKEFIEYYERESEKLRSRREGNLEIDKSTTYYDKKIEHDDNLLEILRNCEESEEIAQRNKINRHTEYMIESFLEKLDKAKREENKEAEREVIDNFIKRIIEQFSKEDDKDD